MTKTTRQRILDHLDRRGLASATEIARLLQVTPADVRHHLKSLRDQGVVTVVASKPNAGESRPGVGREEKTSRSPTHTHDSGLSHGPGHARGSGHARGLGHARGRPTHLYALTSQVERHNLDGLSAVLLRLSVQSSPDEERHTILGQIANGLLEGSPAPTGSLTHRLTQTVPRLNELGYQARWEASPQAPRLSLAHCPYAAIIDRHPELCQMDAALLAQLAGSPVRQVEKLAYDANGLLHCLFLVGKL